MDAGEGGKAGGGGAPSDDGTSSSGEDECCVYTYRGAEAPRPPAPPPRRADSPDMDYLEMDFDPGPSCEDDRSVDNADEDRGGSEGEGPPPDGPQTLEGPASSPPSPDVAARRPPSPGPPPDPDPYGPSTSAPRRDPPPRPARPSHVRRTRATWPAREPEAHRGSGGDLVSPGDADGDNANGEPKALNLSSTLFHCTMAKRLVMDNHAAKFLHDADTSNVDGESCGADDGTPVEPIPKRMIWCEREACSKQVTQIAVSACGATAVINVLLAFDLTIDVDRVSAAVNTRQRANNAPLCRYVISRSIAGCSAEALRVGLSVASDGKVSSRHFATWPERIVSLSRWLAYWMDLGGVPVATLNLQAGITNPTKIPDSWHHQMIFGVGPRGIYMANPLECVEEGALWHQLCSDSVLLVRRKDILSRWKRNTDLSLLADVPGDERWKSMNVLGQIVNMVRESQQNSNDLTRTTHIRIPACYRAGITVAVLTGTDAHKKLLSAPELPLLYDDDE